MAQSATPSPAEQKIAVANRTRNTNDLAFAFCERAEETGDKTYYSQAREALQKSPADYGSRKIEISILLGLHQWPEALESAKELNRRVPDDVAVWGLLAEAYFALGNYAESQRATQWMFDLRPGNAAAYLPAARLREVFGDLDGALDFLNEALRRMPEAETEHRAALLAESSRVLLAAKNPKAAEDKLAEAMLISPHHPQVSKIAALLRKGPL